jgi:AcrR family transcriptional regulator
MQNVVPLEEQLADRALADRRETYSAEVRRLLDATFAVTRRTGSLDPQVRDIVREAGLSNQAFYRHFSSKDALMLAVLADGRRQLVAYLARQIGGAPTPDDRLRRFVRGIMAQARNIDAAEATRPFAVNTHRLAARFPTEVAASRTELLDLIRPAIHDLGGNDRDVEFVHDLAMARMHDALVQQRKPAPAEVDQLISFCLAGVERRADASEPGRRNGGSHTDGA